MDNHLGFMNLILKDLHAKRYKKYSFKIFVDTNKSKILGKLNNRYILM